VWVWVGGSVWVGGWVSRRQRFGACSRAQGACRSVPLWVGVGKCGWVWVELGGCAGELKIT